MCTAIFAVRSFGDEGRRPTQPVLPQAGVFEIVIFKGGYIVSSNLHRAGSSAASQVASHSISRSIAAFCCPAGDDIKDLNVLQDDPAILPQVPVSSTE